MLKKKKKNMGLTKKNEKNEKQNVTSVPYCEGSCRLHHTSIKQIKKKSLFVKLLSSLLRDSYICHITLSYEVSVGAEEPLPDLCRFLIHPCHCFFFVN